MADTTEKQPAVKQPVKRAIPRTPAPAAQEPQEHPNLILEEGASYKPYIQVGTKKYHFPPEADARAGWFAANPTPYLRALGVRLISFDGG